jgi:CRP/FNR family transcriptional regulator, cyclic AMP receptor protein
LLDPLSDDERLEILRRARRRRFAKGEVIFHEGDPGDALHLLAKGHVAVRVTTPLGDIATLLVVKPGEFFGEMALVSPAARSATVVALDDAETVSIHRELLEALRAEHPAVDRLLVDTLIADVRRLSTLLIDALYVPVEMRMWRRLLDLTQVYASERNRACIVPLTQEDLAELVGATRPTVNRLLRSAEEAGLLRVGRGKVEILDAEALARRAR